MAHLSATEMKQRYKEILLLEAEKEEIEIFLKNGGNTLLILSYVVTGREYKINADFLNKESQNFIIQAMLKKRAEILKKKIEELETVE